MAELYKSYLGRDRKAFFESKVLIHVMKKLGMGKKHLMEDILTKRDPDRVLEYYSKSQYINSEFL